MPRAFDAGKARRISGLSVEDGALVIRLVNPAPDLPRALALPVFCAIPEDTPVVPHGLETPIASAGPYYLAAHTEAAAVLKRNPNYGGDRPQHLDAIVYEFGIAPAAAAARIEDGTLDYILEWGPDLSPGSAAARSAGSRSRLTPTSPPQVHFLAFNTDRPLFADIRMRRAVQFALDRRELARLDPEGQSLVATSLIPRNMPGFDTEPLYPLRGDLRTARKLAGGRKATAVVYMFDDKSAFSTAFREELAAIGIRIKILPAVNADFGPGGKFLEKALRSDLIWGGEGIETGDLASYLERLYLFPREEAEVARILKLPIPERDERAVALARRVEQPVTLRRLRQQSASGARLAPARLRRASADVPGCRPGRALPEGLRRLTLESGAVAALVLLARPAPARVVAPDVLVLVDGLLLDGQRR